MPNQKKGFTLIELLIAITIVAILASVGFITYSQAQVLARDSRRKQDLGEIAKALQLYYNDMKHYPCTGDWVTSSTEGSWIVNDTTAGTGCTGVFDSNYISKLPLDPVNTGSNPLTSTHYIYSYRSSADCAGNAGKFFVLKAQLENRKDPERLSANNIKWCDNTDLYPNVIPSAFAYVITSL